MNCIIGIPNQNNSCYLNSVLQCLFRCSDLFATIRVNQKEPFCQIFTQMMTYLQESKVQEFHSAVRQLKQQLVSRFGNTQQDAHEALSFLFNKIHQETKIPFVLKLKNISECHAAFGNILHKTLTETYKNDYSFIKTLFAFEQLKSFECLTCNKLSFRVENNTELSVSIADQTKLSDCIVDYFAMEIIKDYVCESCSAQNTLCTTTLIGCPKYMFIVLNRYKLDQKTHNVTKQNHLVEYTEFLDISQFIYRKSITKKYKLVGVINHVGLDMRGGHYYCYVNINNFWLKSDDMKIMQLQGFSEIDQTCTYILLYSCIEE